MTKKTLTPKQQIVLEYLKQTLAQTGTAPSLRTAAADLSTSHAAVAQILKTLEDKGHIRREGRYSRTIHLLGHAGEPVRRHSQVPIIGNITAGLPMYAQQEWEGSVLVDAGMYPGKDLFALRVHGASMKDAGILDQDIAICRPRQYARDREIIVALIHREEATVKRFFLHKTGIELRPENPEFQARTYDFDEVLIQGKVIGILRPPEAMDP